MSFIGGFARGWAFGNVVVGTLGAIIGLIVGIAVVSVIGVGFAAFGAACLVLEPPGFARRVNSRSS